MAAVTPVAIASFFTACSPPVAVVRAPVVRAPVGQAPVVQAPVVQAKVDPDPASRPWSE